MKKILLIMLIGVAVLTIACNQSKDSAISGIYVTAFKNEFSDANDTLVITAYNLESNAYKIERYSGFHRIRDGKILPKEFKKENWMATYDKEKQLLEEPLGRQVYINLKAGTLSFGATYKKIK